MCQKADELYESLWQNSIFCWQLTRKTYKKVGLGYFHFMARSCSLWHIGLGSLGVLRISGGGRLLPIRKKFGERVRFLREARHWSKAKLSKLSGVHEQTICRIEEGQNAPTIETLDKLAAAFKVEPAQMLAFGIPAEKIDELQIIEMLRSADDTTKQMAMSILLILVNG